MLHFLFYLDLVQVGVWAKMLGGGEGYMDCGVRKTKSVIYL